MNRIMKNKMQEYIQDVYGTRRAMLHAFYQHARYQLGLMSRYEEIDWDHVRRLVFICKGNICRSPYAHTVATGLGLPSVSFGLSATTGDRAHPDAVRVAAHRGVDLSRHRATRLDKQLLEHGDLIVGMEPSHLAQAAELIGSESGHIQATLIGIWSSFRRPYLADPYGRNDAYFNTCFSCIDENVRQISIKLLARPA